MKDERNKIFGDVKALMLTKIGYVALNGTDNIIISAFVGVKQVGLLSNFYNSRSYSGGCVYFCKFR